MSWPPQPFIAHPRLGWSIDCSGLGQPLDAYASLPWQRVFEEMTALEAGEIVNVDAGASVRKNQ